MAEAEENLTFQKAVNDLKKIRSPGQVRDARRKALRWYAKKLKKKKVRGTFEEVIKSRKAAGTFKPGQLVSFQYDAKGFREGTLPYYDKFPLIIFLENQKNGNILGLNLHYIPPHVRAIILSELMKPIKAKKIHPNNKMKITYKMVRSMARLKVLKLAIKAYIPGRVKTKMFRIQSDSWQHIIMLPTQRFVGSSERGVWKRGGF